MYGSYTEINQLMVRDGHVLLSTVEKIPEILPNTGLTVFDTRREKTWKTEIAEYLAQKNILQKFLTIIGCGSVLKELQPNL